MAYIFLGLALSRMELTRGPLWRAVAVGALCAALGYTGGWAASRVVHPEQADAYHLISPATEEQCFPAAGSAPVSGSGAGSVTGSASGSSASPGTASGSAGSTGKASAPASGSGQVLPDGYDGLAPALGLTGLATAAPHSNTPFETIGSCGVAVVVIGLLEHLVHVVSLRTTTAD